MKHSPLIGLTMDCEKGGYSALPWFALRENYCTSVSRVGGVPLGLAHVPGQVEELAGVLDGLIITGGAFDIPPECYGESSRHASVTTKDARTAFEFAITHAMLARGKPVLGICGGEQLLNVALGGTLIQHIPDAVENALEHEQKNPRHEPGHRVHVTQDSLLHRIVGANEMMVNSAHHQAVGKPAPGATVSATAGDGVIEAIEFAQHRFCLGVQWHPEYDVTEADSKIFAAMMDACRGN